MCYLAWAAGTSLIVVLTYTDLPDFWLGIAVATAVLLVLGGTLVTMTRSTLFGVPLFLATTGASAAIAAALHDLSRPWNGYLDITALVLLAGFAVTVVVAGTP